MAVQRSGAAGGGEQVLSIEEIRNRAHVLDLVGLAVYRPLHAAPVSGPGGAVGGVSFPLPSSPSSNGRSARE